MTTLKEILAFLIAAIIIIMIITMLTSCVSFPRFYKAYNICADVGIPQYSDAFEACLTNQGVGPKEFRF